MEVWEGEEGGSGHQEWDTDYGQLQKCLSQLVHLLYQSNICSPKEQDTK